MLKILFVAGIAIGLNSNVALAQQDNMGDHENMPGHENMPHGGKGKHGKKAKTKDGSSDKKQPPTEGEPRPSEPGKK